MQIDRPCGGASQQLSAQMLLYLRWQGNKKALRQLDIPSVSENRTEGIQNDNCCWHGACFKQNWQNTCHSFDLLMVYMWGLIGVCSLSKWNDKLYFTSYHLEHGCWIPCAVHFAGNYNTIRTQPLNSMEMPKPILIKSGVQMAELWSHSYWNAANCLFHQSLLKQN